MIVGVATFDAYDLLRQRFDGAPTWALGMAAYLVAVTAILGGMWLYGAAGGDLHPDAFRDGFLNFTGVGLVLVAVLAGVGRIGRWPRPR